MIFESTTNSVSGGFEGEGSDDTVGETSEQLLTQSVPGQGSTLGVLALSTFDLGDRFSFNGADGSLGLVHEVEDLDTLIGTDGDPLELGVESDLVDGGTSVEFSGGESKVEDIPDEELFVLTTGGEVLTVGGDGQVVDVGFVGLEGVSDLEVSVPDLQSTIPTDGGEVGSEGLDLVGSLHDGGVSNARNPVGVVFLFSGGELAFTEDIPELDFSFSTGGENLSVIGGESDGVDFRLVTNESLVGGTCS